MQNNIERINKNSIKFLIEGHEHIVNVRMEMADLIMSCKDSYLSLINGANLVKQEIPQLCQTLYTDDENGEPVEVAWCLGVDYCQDPEEEYGVYIYFPREDQKDNVDFYKYFINTNFTLMTKKLNILLTAVRTMVLKGLISSMWDYKNR